MPSRNSTAKDLVTLSFRALVARVNERVRLSEADLLGAAQRVNATNVVLCENIDIKSRIFGERAVVLVGGEAPYADVDAVKPLLRTVRGVSCTLVPRYTATVPLNRTERHA